jgi:predicted peptidase
MGGYGTWGLATLRPDWFASAMPVCGGGCAAFARNLVDIPIRAFHGLCDKTVDPIESLQMVKAVNNAGGHAELILFPELAHNCWDAAYSDERNYDWLLSFTTERDKSLVEKLSGNYYG